MILYHLILFNICDVMCHEVIGANQGHGHAVAFRDVFAYLECCICNLCLVRPWPGQVHNHGNMGEAKSKTMAKQSLETHMC